MRWVFGRGVSTRVAVIPDGPQVLSESSKRQVTLIIFITPNSEGSFSSKCTFWVKMKF